MEKLVPILPCSDTPAQIGFYTHLGFELVGQYTRSYLVFRYDELELHFFGSKMFPPDGNPSMSCIQTDNLEHLYAAFTGGLKAEMDKIPRTGFPRISKIRDLGDDRRFTVADPSGNTIYVIQQKQAGSGAFFRDISNKQYAEKFAILYDLICSKEDLTLAGNLLPRLLEAKESLGELDRAKLLLLALEIDTGLGIPHDSTELELLLGQNDGRGEWELIDDKWKEIRP